MPGAFGRATLFALGGGLLGALLYYGVAAIAGYEFGIIAIVVGILVGKGVRKGAGLHRHWLYPALGIGITYLAIVSTYVPQVLGEVTAEGHLQGGAEVTPTALLGALLISLVVPLLMLFQGSFWGPIILAIGLWEGWRYGKATKLEFRGPLEVGPREGLDESTSLPDGPPS
jgi:hypothetical protein